MSQLTEAAAYVKKAGREFERQITPQPTVIPCQFPAALLLIPILLVDRNQRGISAATGIFPGALQAILATQGDAPNPT